MHTARLLLLLLGGLLLIAAWPGPAAADTAGACSVTQAERDVRAAKRAYVRATVRLREARHVLDQTRYYVRVYGPGVGRWCRLVRRSGFKWADFPTALYVINRETGGTGDPSVTNPSSGAAGLWQFMPDWWQGKWDPYHAPTATRHAAKAVYGGSGWAPWSL